MIFAPTPRVDSWTLYAPRRDDSGAAASSINSMPCSPMTADLRLAEIRLKNWKAYRKADISLPDDPAKRVVLLGGQNGAGKTSIIEALSLGLYGREGLGLVARAQDRRRGEASYDGFLERALNREARHDGTMSVELVFTGGPRNRVALERVWYFTSAGRHERDDEDVRLREGEDEDLIPIPVEGRDEFLRDYVEAVLLPRNLASFFIFDGEHVDRLAGQDLEGQVRSAVEAVLGVPVLRQTIQDLRVYARERRRDSKEADGSYLGVLKDEVSALEAQEDSLTAAVEGTNQDLAPLRAQRDELVSRIGSLHGDSYANFKGLFEAREILTRNRADQQEALRRALSVDLAFALTGETLRNAVKSRLVAESLRDQWLSGLETSDQRYAAFIGLLGDGLKAGRRLTELRSAWEAVWNTPPEGSSQDMRHGHLGDAERLLVSRHLEQVSDAAGDRIGELARDVQGTDTAITDLESQIALQNGVDERSQALADDLRKVQELIATLDAKHRLDVQALDALRLDLAPRKAELGRLIQRHVTAAPVLRRADRAEAYASVLEDMIETILPGEMAALSENVTRAYLAMAHKGEVDRVDISMTGDVRLLNAGGEDLRGRDSSAGETQIFALSLMAAVAASAPAFPMVMDTPFARLDPSHRRNVMAHFAGLGTQLILLAHPAEIASEDLAALGPALARPIEIVNTSDGGARSSRVRPLTERPDGA